MQELMDKSQIKRVWRRQILFLPVFFALLFAPAWSLDYWQAWLYGFLFMATTIAIDHHWHWSSVPPWLVLVSDGLVVLGLLGTAVVFRHNSYAAATIRVEAEQPVVSTGAYAIVRHPMYAAALLMVVFTPLALGSYWSLLIVLALIPALAWRLLDEERFLKQNLPGYADYCRKVRWRLIPGLW